MYEIKTPIILESVEAAREAITGIRRGSLEPRHAAVLISGARALQAGIATDIKARLALPKIEAQEALLVEESKQQKITDQAQSGERSKSRS